MPTSIPHHVIDAFIASCPDAAMITRRPDGHAHVARLEVASIDGRLRSTGSANLVRIRNLRSDRRATLFVFDEHPWWLGIETETTIIEGPAAGPELVRFLRARHPGTPAGTVMAHDDDFGGDRPLPEEDYLTRAAMQQLLLVDFKIARVYGNLPTDVAT